jgi:HSP20 family protein
MSNFPSKGGNLMAEINVVKRTKEGEFADWFEAPVSGGSLFGVNPFALVRQFTNDMDRLFSQAPRAVSEAAAWTPAVEVKIKEGKFVVTAELPGIVKEDLKVHVHGDKLFIEGERKQEREEQREGFYHSERSYGKFYRSIALPQGAKPEEITARFNNGVLEVTTPLAQARGAPKQIPVEQGATKAA